MRKRLLVLLLVILTVLSLILPASAAGGPSLSLTSGSVKAGETVELTLTIQDNPGIAAIKLFIYYDTKAFSLSTTTGVKAVGDFGEDGAVMNNTIALAKENNRYDGVPGKDGVIVLWYNAMGINTTSDGEMLKLKLRALDGAVSGDHTVSVGYSYQDTATEQGDKVSFRTGSTTVTVTGGEDGKIEEEAPVTPVEFTDVSGHWAETYIRQAATAGLVEGYRGKYRPNDTMTRAEFVTILWRAQGEPKPRARRRLPT